MKVHFRQYPEGDIIALFPELLGTNQPGTCESYQHLGQHSAADYRGVIASTRPVKRGEHLPLLAELRRIGYTDITMVTRARCAS